jgi:hypothetical protein
MLPLVLVWDGLELMNAIIAAATGYSEGDLQPFLDSVERTCPCSRLFLIVFKHDLVRVEKLRARYPFIEPVYDNYKPKRGIKLSKWIARYFIGQDYSNCRPLWRSVGTYLLHITLKRYLLALRILRESGGSFANFLLTDSRDVLLQEDPFDRIGDRLVSGVEEKTVGDCPHNSYWIEQIYGPAVLSRMSPCKIVCSGVTVGPVYKMEPYLVAMCGEMWKHLAKAAASPYFDQAIHNYLIYGQRVRLELTENSAGIIATLFYEDRSNIETDAATGRLVVRGKLPAIVHQYDRHADLATFVRQREHYAVKGRR